MIKLERRFTPLQFTPAFSKTQTDKFKATGEAVWNILWLKEGLLELSHNKCSYCECDIKEESKYLEVEHFKHKDVYKDDVMIWENLLPSCKRCNGTKNDHDVIISPIINPFIDTPSDHLKLQNYRFKNKDIKGKTTIDVVGLNHVERAVKKRFEIGQAFEDLIVMAEERLEAYTDMPITVRKNKLKNIVEGILKESQPNSIYAATCATILHVNDSYEKIKKEMLARSLWTNEMDELHKISKSIVLCPVLK